MNKLGKFREQTGEESDAQYFKAAVFKAAGGKDLNPAHEGPIQRFVSLCISKAGRDQGMLTAGYFYAVSRFAAPGKLHLSADDAFALQAAGGGAEPHPGQLAGPPLTSNSTFIKESAFYFTKIKFYV